MAKYDYLCKLSRDIESKIIQDKVGNPKFNLNRLINDLLNKHYGIKPKDSKAD